jgi:exopolyphosphatase/guanosine-5'-triphosphate,3'-diphosphate pyrophosphatase
VDETLEYLANLSLEQRAKVEGLTSDRVDVIVPGLTILQTNFRHTRSSRYVVCGSGLREGVYYETVRPDNPCVDDVLDHSVSVLQHRSPFLPLPHLEQVRRLSLLLFDGLREFHRLDDRTRVCLDAAARLYRLGTAINYYSYEKHTFYLITQARLNGMSHREILLTALTASYSGKKKTRKAYLAYQDLLNEKDLQLAFELGTLLQLAIALDSSQSQLVESISVHSSRRSPELRLHCSREPKMEWAEAEALLKEFKKVWGFLPSMKVEVSSRT